MVFNLRLTYSSKKISLPAKIISQILPATGSGSASTGSSASSCGSVIDGASGERATQQGTLTLGSGRGAGSSKSPKKKRRTGFELTGVDAKVKQIKKNYLNSCVNKWRHCVYD